MSFLRFIWITLLACLAAVALAVIILLGWDHWLNRQPLAELPFWVAVVVFGLVVWRCIRVAKARKARKQALLDQKFAIYGRAGADKNFNH